MNKLYTYLEYPKHGLPTKVFECHAPDILAADQLAKDAGINPMLPFISTTIGVKLVILKNVTGKNLWQEEVGTRKTNGKHYRAFPERAYQSDVFVTDVCDSKLHLVQKYEALVKQHLYDSSSKLFWQFSKGHDVLRIWPKSGEIRELFQELK